MRIVRGRDKSCVSGHSIDIHYVAAEVKCFPYARACVAIRSADHRNIARTAGQYNRCISVGHWCNGDGVRIFCNCSANSADRNHPDAGVV